MHGYEENERNQSVMPTRRSAADHEEISKKPSTKISTELAVLIAERGNKFAINYTEYKFITQ
jgi:hypothetical protein